MCLITQLCPTLCDPTDCRPPGSSVHGDSPGNNTGVLPCPHRPYAAAATAAKSLQSCPTLCDPIDSSPPGSTVLDSPGKHTGVGCHFLLQCIKVKSENEVPQSCPILRDPMDCSLPGSSVHGIFQARVLEWVAIAFSEIIRFLIYPPTDLHSFCNRSVLSSIYMQKFSWLQIIKRCPSFLRNTLKLSCYHENLFLPPLPYWSMTFSNYIHVHSTDFYRAPLRLHSSVL